MKETQSYYQPVYPTEPQRWGEPSFLRLQERESARTRDFGTAESSGCVSGGWLRKAMQLGLFLSVGVLSYAGYQFASRYISPTIVVQDNSMVPALQEGSRFTLNRWSYFRRPPQRGDLVVINTGHEEYAVKRVIAKPCDSVYFKRGEVLVNGERLLENYLPRGTQPYTPEAPETFLIVGKDRYFVLSDNRNSTEDSRNGSVPRTEIVGTIVPECGLAR